MGLEISVTVSKDKINLGETVTATYNCSGAYDCTLQADNMSSPIVFGTGDVSGSIKFLPVVSGEFNITLTALGVVHQNKGLDVDQVEANVARALVIVS
jgi:hypothetical protein